MRSPRWLRRLLDVAELHARIFRLRGRVGDLERQLAGTRRQLARVLQLHAAADFRAEQAQRALLEAEERVRDAEDVTRRLLLERREREFGGES